MWQWGWFNGIANQVTRYSTFFGSVWYVVVFVFRLIVVLGLGSSVYGDEQGNFKCSATGAGCEQACYNQFTQMSHLRFWGFQLLALFTPVIAFHFLATYITGQLAKIKEAEKKQQEEEDGDNTFVDDRHRHYEEKKTRNRKKIVGKVQQKKVYNDGSLIEIPINDKIKVAYFISVALRLAIETVFLYLTYVEYNYPDYLCQGTRGLLTGIVPDELECNDGAWGLHFLWAAFPEIYPCRRLPGSGVFLACTQNIAFNSVVPCWTSRAFEKTVFMRYMNVLGVISFLLCALEILYIPLKEIMHVQKKRSSQVQVDFYRNYPKPRPNHGGELPPQTHNSTVYSTHGDYSLRRQRDSYYDQHELHERQRLAPPPNEPPPQKKYDEYRA